MKWNNMKLADIEIVHNMQWILDIWNLKETTISFLVRVSEVK